LSGVIYIGDRKAGKTHLAKELANPNNLSVTVESPYQKVAKGGFVATKADKSIYDSYFEGTIFNNDKNTFIKFFIYIYIYIKWL
jgi:hypothetical protein